MRRPVRLLLRVLLVLIGIQLFVALLVVLWGVVYYGFVCDTSSC